MQMMKPRMAIIPPPNCNAMPTRSVDKVLVRNVGNWFARLGQRKVANKPSW